MNGSLQGKLYSEIVGSPAIVSILLNDFCNLRCKTCYLESMLEKNPLDREEWRKVFHSLFRDLQPQALTFVGKEVFAEEESANILFDAIEIRDKIQGSYRITEVGVITNGTLIHKYRDKLERISLDWMDISIDGPKEFNDLIRGKGAYSLLERNLGWVSRLFADKLWVVPTLCNANASSMVTMMEELNSKYGVANFSLGLYKNRASAPDLFNVNREEVMRFVCNLQKANVKTPIKVIFGYSVDDIEEYLPIFDVPESHGETITEKKIQLENGIEMVVQRNNKHVGLWRAIRVSSEGYWLAAEDLVDHRKYKINAVANLRGVNYDTRRAYEIGIQSPRAISLVS